MAVKVILPAALRPLCGGKRQVFLQGATVQELIHNLQDEYPNLRGRLCGSGGEIREFIRIFKNSEDTHFMRGGDTPVEDGDEIELVPAVLGG